MIVEASVRKEQWVLFLAATLALAFGAAFWVASLSVISVASTSYLAENGAFDANILLGRVLFLFFTGFIFVIAASLVVAFLAFGLSAAAHPFIRKAEGLTRRRLIYAGVFSAPMSLIALFFASFTIAFAPVVGAACLVLSLAGCFALAWWAAVAIYPMPVEAPVGEQVELVAV